MSDQLRQIVAFRSRRYNEDLATRPGLAKAHLAIINRAKDVQLSSGNIGDLLDFLSKPQTDPDTAKAAKEVLELIGAAPRSESQRHGCGQSAHDAGRRREGQLR